MIAGAWEHPNRRSRRCYLITDTGEAERRLLAIELEPNLEAIAATIDLIRHELVDTAHGQPAG